MIKHGGSESPRHGPRRAGCSPRHHHHTPTCRKPLVGPVLDKTVCFNVVLMPSSRHPPRGAGLITGGMAALNLLSLTEENATNLDHMSLHARALE